jgi:hypothetical protein
VVDFLGGDFLPTAIDDFPYAAGEKKVPVVVEESEIPSLEPIACKRGLGRDRVAIVARHDARAPDYDLSRLTVCQQSSSLAHNRDVQTDWYAGRSGLAPGRRERIARDRCGSGFRHSIVLDHGRFEGRLQFHQDVRWQRSGSGTDETQTAVRQSLLTAPNLSENCLMYGGHRGVPRRLELSEPRKEAVGVPTRSTYDARTGRQRGH